MVEIRGDKKVLVTPVSAEDLKDIKIGDIVWLDGDLMTCRDVVAMGRYPYTNYFGRLTKEDEVIVNESLKKVSALDIAENDFSQISDGQRQRIMLMITALLNKKIVLLDEPTSALDPDSISLIIDYIHAMRETTVVMVSHDTRFIEAFDRKIYIGD